MAVLTVFQGNYILNEHFLNSCGGLVYRLAGMIKQPFTFKRLAQSEPSATNETRIDGGAFYDTLAFDDFGRKDNLTSSMLVCYRGIHIHFQWTAYGEILCIRNIYNIDRERERFNAGSFSLTCIFVD